MTGSRPCGDRSLRSAATVTSLPVIVSRKTWRSNDRIPFHWISAIIAGLVLACLPGCQGKGKKEAAQRELNRLVDQAHSAAEQGDVWQAERLLSAAVEADPSDCETRLQLSELLQEHGSLADAVAHLQRAAEQNPEDPRAFVLLAQILFEQGQIDAADQHAERALALDPHLIKAILLRGQIAERKGDQDVALRSYYEALAIEPDRPEPRYLAARQLYERGSADQAAPLLRRLLEESSACGRHEGDAWWLLGQCYARQERWHDAAYALAAGIEQRDPSGSDWRDLAYAQFRAGELQAARSSLGMALKLSPADPDVNTLRRAVENAVTPTVRLTEGQSSGSPQRPPRND